jgi:hypothetical protein
VTAKINYFERAFEVVIDAETPQTLDVVVITNSHINIFTDTQLSATNEFILKLRCRGEKKDRHIRHVRSMLNVQNHVGWTTYTDNCHKKEGDDMSCRHAHNFHNTEQQFEAATVSTAKRKGYAALLIHCWFYFRMAHVNEQFIKFYVGFLVRCTRE